MELSHIVVLALVQGLTEFLPVSSSGHLVAVRIFMDIPDAGGTAVDAFLHLGTLAAVLTYYWRIWAGIIRGLFVRDEEGNDKRALFGKIIVATIPAAIVGYLAQDFVSETLRGGLSVAVGLTLTAIILLVGDVISKKSTSIYRASTKDAFKIGVAQIAALIPGVSRSGTTIAAGRALGLSRKQAITFSFLMSVPIIAGAGLGTFGSLLNTPEHSASVLTVGFFVSFVSGFAAIYFLSKMVERISFKPFAVYLLALAAVLVMVSI